jgi:hypothetical protein
MGANWYIFTLYAIPVPYPIVNKQLESHFAWSEDTWTYTIPPDTFILNGTSDKVSASIVRQDFTYTANLKGNYTLPDWMSFSSDNRSFYVEKTIAGDYEIIVHGFDANRVSVNASFKLTVYEKIYDKYNIYYSGIVLVVALCIVIIVIVFINTI